MVYRSWPWRRSRSRSAELGRPSKLDVHRVGDGSGLAGQDEAGLTILGFEDVVRRHVDLTGYDGAHARPAVAFATRMGRIDACREQNIDKRRTRRPVNAMAMSVEIHFSYGHGQ
jgi:hypothetical protein